MKSTCSIKYPLIIGLSTSSNNDKSIIGTIITSNVSRIKKRGKVTNQVKILLTLLVMIVPMMLLSLVLDVLRPMMSGYLTLHALFICVHIEIGQT